MMSHDVSAPAPGGPFAKILRYISQKLFYGSCLFLFALVVAVSYEVVARGIFGYPTVWSFDVSCYLMLFLIFLGVAYVLQLNRFVRIDFLYDSLSKKNRRVIDAIEPLLSLIWISVLTWQSGKLAFRSLRQGWGSGTELGVPVGYIQIFIVIGLFLLFLQVLLRIRANMKALMNRNGDAHPSGKGSEN